MPAQAGRNLQLPSLEPRIGTDPGVAATRAVQPAMAGYRARSKQASSAQWAWANNAMSAMPQASPLNHGYPSRSRSITASASSPHATLQQLRQLRFPCMPCRQKTPDVTGHGHARLMAVLLEEHPAQGLQAARAFDPPEQECPGFGQYLPVFTHQQGHLAGRVQGTGIPACGSGLASCPSRSRHKTSRVDSTAGAPCGSCPTRTCRAPSASLQSHRRLIEAGHDGRFPPKRTEAGMLPTPEFQPGSISCRFQRTAAVPPTDAVWVTSCPSSTGRRSPSG